MHIALIAGCLVLILIAALALGFLLPRRRSLALERKALETGFRFVHSAKPFEGTNVSGFTLLEDGFATFVENLLERTTGNCRFLIFDLLLVGESANLVTTLAAVRVPGLRLPIFQVGAKNVIDKVVERAEKALGKRLIEFSADHEFATHFSVHCSDHTEVCTFLTPAKIEFLRRHAAKCRIETSPDWLFIYRPGFKVESDNLQYFVDVTVSIASVLLSIQATPLPVSA